MKIAGVSFVLFFLCLGNECFSQVTDSALRVFNLDSLAREGAVFVVDGILSNQTPPKLDADSVFSLDIISKEKSAEIFNSERATAMVIIVTRKAIMNAYQKKLGRYSMDYQDYIKDHRNDEGICYVISINGSPTSFKAHEQMLTLYKVLAGNIENVKFQKQQTCCGVNTWVYVSIKK